MEFDIIYDESLLISVLSGYNSDEYNLMFVDDYWKLIILSSDRKKNNRLVKNLAVINDYRYRGITPGCGLIDKPRLRFPVLVVIDGVRISPQPEPEPKPESESESEQKLKPKIT